MCDKKCFSKREAEGVLKRAKKAHKEWRREIRMYYCEEHNCWHCTSHELIDHTIPVEINLKYKNKWKKTIKSQ